MRILCLLIAALAGCVGCNVTPLTEPVEAGLALTGQTTHYAVHRSTRWVLADPSSIVLTGDYPAGANDGLVFMTAAREGMARVLPQIMLHEAPLTRAALADEIRRAPAELRVHVAVPQFGTRWPLPGGARAFDVEVSLLDGRSGAMIDRARLRLAPAWWQARVDHLSIARLFEKYAAQLLASQ